jgi:hypothetical protein
MLARSTRTNSRKVSGSQPISQLILFNSIVLLRSEQFDFTDLDVDLKTVDYMKLLDTDKDSHIGFFDFLQPILNVVPTEVLSAFTQDQRFKQETFNDLRLAYDAVKRTVGNVVQAEVEAIKNKLYEKGLEQSKSLLRAVDQLVSLIKHDVAAPIN